MKIGSPAERLYLRDGFDGLESGPSGAYRWTHESARLVLPRAGPGKVTARLTLFDAAPAPRALSISLDGRPVYSGSTRPGGTPYVLEVSGVAESESPALVVSTAPWSPPGDRRVLGVAVTGLEVQAPDAAVRARWAEGVLLLGVLVLVAALAQRVAFRVAPVIGGLAVLGFMGAAMAYGDEWLNGLAPATCVACLVAAAIVMTRPHIELGTRRTAVGGALLLTVLLMLFTLGRFNTGDAEGMFQVTAGLAEDGIPWQHGNH